MRAGTMIGRLVPCLAGVACWCLVAAPAFAQTKADPERWTGSLSAGFAFTSGNADTATTNFAFDVNSPSKAKNIVRAEALTIRSSREDVFIVNRTSFSGRDEYWFFPRVYAFGQFGYLSDVFKNLDYLMVPAVGIGYKLLQSDSTSIAVDGSVGTAIEKDTGFDATATGSLGFKLNASHKLSMNATTMQSFEALWKAGDFGDSLYVLRLGVSAGIMTHLQLKAEFLDTFKNEVPDVAIEKNDIAFVTSVAFTF